jgi:predicted RNA-binding protein with PUA-like domain
MPELFQGDSPEGQGNLMQRRALKDPHNTSSGDTIERLRLQRGIMNYWLMKSEPTAYSIERLEAEGKTLWDGVRNYQARNFLKQMAVGDTVVISFQQKFSETISLDELKERFGTEDFALVKKGNRLSVLPVAKKIAQKIYG